MNFYEWSIIFSANHPVLCFFAIMAMGQAFCNLCNWKPR